MRCYIYLLCITSEWCGRGDSNPHALRRHPLKMVRLPVPPLPHEVMKEIFVRGPTHAAWTDADRVTSTAPEPEPQVPERALPVPESLEPESQALLASTSLRIAAVRNCR